MKNNADNSDKTEAELGVHAKAMIVRKEKLLKSLYDCYGIVSDACKKAGISRETYYLYLREDKDFATATEMVADSTIDYVEGKLFKRIAKEDMKAIEFYLSTRGKKRGYVRKQEIDLAQVSFNVEISPI